jgi:outer membrane lipoprotein-sorting protein
MPESSTRRMPRLARPAARGACLAAVVLLTVAVSARPAPPDLFDEIHMRTRAAEATRRTIRARFTQTTVSSLLVKPVVARGTILAAKPAQLAMTYTAPERKTIVMDGNRVVTRHEQGPVEVTDVTEVLKTVEHYFVNATPDDLRKSFVVRASLDPDMTPAGYQVDLVPKRKQIKQGLERLQVWVTREPLVLWRIKMTFPGGDSDTITVDEVQFNVSVPANAFDSGLPAPSARKKQ